VEQLKQEVKDLRERNKGLKEDLYRVAYNGSIGRATLKELNKDTDSQVVSFTTWNKFLERESIWLPQKQSAEPNILKKAYLDTEVGGRKITLVAVSTDKGVYVGHSICMPADEYSKELSRKISLGRAMSKNRLGEHTIDNGLTKEYSVLKGICMSYSNKVKSEPEKYIKGFKKKEQKE
jgi:hypothetical protein